MAVKAAKTIQARVSNEPDFAAAAINCLMGPTGAVNFDQITKTKTVEKIVTEADPEALKQIVALFERLIAVPGTDDSKAAASSRQNLANLLVSIVRSRASAKAEEGDFYEAIEAILSVFVRFAYFVDKGDKSGDQPSPQPPVTQATQELFRNRINSCLNSLIGARKDPASLPYAVVRKIRDAVKSAEFGKFIIDMDDTIKESVDGALKSLKKLSSKVNSIVLSFFSPIN